MTTLNNQLNSSENIKSIVHIPIDTGFSCIRGLSPKKLRFEIEFSLAKGTTSNTFIFHQKNSSEKNRKTILINPPGANFQEVFLPALNTIVHICVAPTYGSVDQIFLTIGKTDTL